MPATTAKPLRLRSPLKVHGGKFYTASWIVENFPPEYQKLKYVEPFAGGANVLFRKTPSVLEWVGDLNAGLMAFYWSLQETPEELLARLHEIEYSHEVFAAAKAQTEFASKLDLAVNEYILRRMSRGALKRDFAWSDRLRGGQPGDVNAWQNALKLLPAVAERVQYVSFYQGHALDLLELVKIGSTPILAYLDPPYLPTTRVAKKAYGAEEMGEVHHYELLQYIKDYPGQVLISGYRSDMYDGQLASWNRVEREVANHSGQSRTKSRKVECLWKNF